MKKGQCEDLPLTGRVNQKHSPIALEAQQVGPCEPSSS